LLIIVDAVACHPDLQHISIFGTKIPAFLGDFLVDLKFILVPKIYCIAPRILSTKNVDLMEFI